MKFLGLHIPFTERAEPSDEGRTLTVDDLDPYSYDGQQYTSPAHWSVYDGSKFPGGFGPTQIQWPDYWTLRARSTQLFNENLYAKGLIRRLITNEIGPGLMPEASPVESILQVEEGSLADWTDTVEDRFEVWSESSQTCSWDKQHTFGELQRIVRREALIAGDVLVLLRYNPRIGAPSIQIIRGERVQTPVASDSANQTRKGHRIVHGIEYDTQGREVAYWILQPDGIKSKRLPAFGEKSGRRLAWLVFGTEKRVDDVRGMPLLGVIMQSIKELDRYRDSIQRKAVVNSMLAMFIKKDADKPGTLPISNGAVRKDTVTVVDGAAANPPRKPKIITVEINFLFTILLLLLIS
jgi:capsid protein